MRSFTLALFLLSDVGSFAQSVEQVKIAINELSDCSETNDSLTLSFVRESKVYWVDSTYKVMQTADGKINYVFVEDASEQYVTRFAWVPIPSSIYAGNSDSLLQFSDLIDTTEIGFDFYVGPVMVSDHRYDDFLHPVGGAMRFQNDQLYRQIATCTKLTGGMECKLIDRNSFCEINIPPYDLFLTVSHETVAFKD
jgi:hypothetical protein